MLDKLNKESVVVEDDEAIQIITETGFKQVQRSFEKLTEAIIAGNSEDKIDAAIEKQTLAMSTFVDAVKKIEINPTEMVSLLSEIRDDIVFSNKELSETIKTRLLPDTFFLNKGYTGETESVQVHYKPANQITKNK